MIDTFPNCLNLNTLITSFILMLLKIDACVYGCFEVIVGNKCTDHNSLKQIVILFLSKIRPGINE